MSSEQLEILCDGLMVYEVDPICEKLVAKGVRFKVVRVTDESEAADSRGSGWTFRGDRMAGDDMLVRVRVAERRCGTAGGRSAADRRSFLRIGQGRGGEDLRSVR